MTTEGELPGRSERSLPSPPPSSRRAMAPWYALLAVLVSAVIVGSWWVISRPAPPPPELPEESGPAAVASVPLTVPVVQSPEAEAPTPAPSSNRIDTDTVPALAPRAREAARQAARAAPAEDRVRPPSLAEQRDPLLTPTVPMIYRTDPDRGRLVQLGAFPTRDEADDAWRRLTRRYPYLRTKPRMVSPVEVRGLGNRPARLYRLQLGTASQAQSLVICQQLERAGQSCVVVYR